MVILIGCDNENIVGYLSENKLDVRLVRAEQVPSLTGMLLAGEDISDIVLLQGQEKNWSMGHILAAAKQLQGKGHIYSLSPAMKLPALLCAAVSASDLLIQLKRSMRSTTDTSSGGGGQKAHLPQASVPPAQKGCPAVRPLSIPSGRILFLGVVGSQHRIGCTTQAVGLWHYCKALGFDAAIVSSKEQIAQIAGPMQCKEIPSGYIIEDIPFVAETALQYDCYILDMGPGPVPAALQATDCLVLVAGCKPWEIQHTAAALRSAKGKELPVLLSFASEADAYGLKPLFGGQSVAVAPWVPELWQPSGAALAIYDSLLRPILERVLAMSNQITDNELLN